MTVTHTKRKSVLSTANKPGLHYNCDECLQDITQIVRISCAECDDCDLCPECFAEGAEFAKHEKSHKYKIVEPYCFGVFENDWRADEEILLLEACESNGLGNWYDIAEHVGTKTSQQCKEHYFKVYIDHENYPNPNPNLKSNQKNIQVETQIQVKRDIHSLVSQPASHEICGFMPHRFEFECEIDNEAESSIKDLVFEDDEPLSERNVKLTMLEIYENYLEKRQVRKKFIFDRKLTDYKAHLASEKARPKEDRELINSLKPFARFCTPTGFNTLVDGLVVENELRQRIRMLQDMRREGITKFSAIPNAEKSKKVRDTKVPELPKLIESLGTSRAATPKSAGQPRKVGMPLDLTNCVDYDLLSPSEQDLCSILRLIPKVYLEIKETLLREQAKNGFLKRATARSTIKIDVNKTSKIYDFFVSAGWVRPIPLPE